MSLTSTLNSALSGLRVTQAQMGVVSTNIANVDSVGYARRSLTVLQQVSGDRTTGARVAGIERQLDQLLQRQLRTETAAASYTDVRARYAAQLDQLFGTPGSPAALDSTVNAFASALQTLVTNPADLAARQGVLAAASTLAVSLNRLSSDVQAMRETAETRIGDGVRRLNDLLAGIQAADAQIEATGFNNTAAATLLDERDRLIDELSGLVDVRVTIQDGQRVQIFTGGGLQLFGGGQRTTFSFDQRGALEPNALFTADPATRGVGTIRANVGAGAGIDVIADGLFRSGEIAAEVAMRDRVLVETQAGLDELAAGLAAALGDRNPTSPFTNGVNAGFDIGLEDPTLPGQLAMRAGNTLAIDVNGPTGPRRFQFIATDGTAPNPLPAEMGEGGAILVRYDRAGGIAGLAGAVGAALGPGYTVTLEPGNVMRVVNAGGATTVTGARASFTSGATVNAGPDLPLFVDGGGTTTPYAGSLDGLNPQKRGFAGRIAINAAVLADPSLLVRYGTAPPTQAGDPARPQRLLERLSADVRGFAAGSGISDVASGARLSVSGFARRLVENQSAKATQALRVDEGQKVVLNNLQARFSETSGVSIDQEMADLVEIQNAYAANARVVSAVRDLLDTLLRIGG
jgi:flagellar hook-associated protein 1 FlgK